MIFGGLNDLLLPKFGFSSCFCSPCNCLFIHLTGQLKWWSIFVPHYNLTWLTGVSIFSNNTCSLISAISERKKGLIIGYTIHHRSVLGKCFTLDDIKPTAALRIQILGWQIKGHMILISSQSFIFWNKPRSDKLVNELSTFSTTNSSASTHKCY